jgi:hypothetical protein
METLALTMLCSALMMYDAGKRLVVELTDCMLFANLCQETRGKLVHEQTSIENNAEVYAKDASVSVSYITISGL